MALGDFLTRTGTATELPEQIASELVEATIRESVVLTMARQVPTTTRDSRIPVVNTLPQASWVGTGVGGDPDTGLKSVTAMNILNEQLIAEELAAIAVIPQNVIDDETYDIWAAVRPELASAIARAYDAAVLFGTNAPTTFPPSLVQQATTANNFISGAVTDITTDLPQLVLQAAQMVSEMGYNPDAVAVNHGWQFRAAQSRTTQLVANPLGAGTPFPLLMAGLRIRVDPLWWEAAKADSIVAQWNLVLCGLRKDITLEPFREGVITDSTGKVIQNLMMEDKVAVRATFRAGYYLAAPPTGVQGVTTPCPVAIVTDNGTTRAARSEPPRHEREGSSGASRTRHQKGTPLSE